MSVFSARRGTSGCPQVPGFAGRSDGDTGPERFEVINRLFLYFACSLRTVPGDQGGAPDPQLPFQEGRQWVGEGLTIKKLVGDFERLVGIEPM